MNQVATKEKKEVAPALALLYNKQTMAEIQRALPKVFSPDRFIRIAVTELRKNSALAECDPYSFLGAVIQSAQLGLEIGSGLGYAYLVPYGKECQLITGYKGEADLTRRSGKISGIHLEVVYKQDQFDYFVEKSIVKISHKPDIFAKKADSDIIGAYGIASFVHGGEPQVSFMSVHEIIEIRDKYAKGAKRSDSPWQKNFGEMCKKTVCRRLAKMLPKSPELVMANQIEDGERPAHQPFIDLGIIDAEYSPSGGHDPKKAAKEQSEGHKAPPMEHEIRQQSDEQKAALSEYERAADEYEKNGGHVKNALVGIDPAKIKDMEAKRIRAATAILVDLMKKGTYK